MLAVLVLALIVKLTFTFECGLVNQDPSSARVVGGERTTYFKYPWFASIHVPYVMNHQTCAGALISPEFVLTAAHCYAINSTSPKKDFYHVTLGIYDQCLDNFDATTYRTSNVYVHEKFVDPEDFYDIALIKLDGSSILMPVCLPPQGTPIKYLEHAEIVGFGRQDFTLKKQPCELHEASVEIFTAAQCEKQSNVPRDITRKMDELQTSFCAGKMAGGTDTCQGDSGGSILVKQKNRYFSRGIVSFGYGCAEPNLPGVYTNVASYIDWINDTMRGRLEMYQAPHSKKKPKKRFLNKIFHALG